MRGVWLGLVLLGTAQAAAQELNVSPLAKNYGFLPVEVTKLSSRASHLQAGDFNDDGLTDLVVINNERHRLDLLIQRRVRDKNANAQLVIDRDANRIEDHWRFELRRIPVDQEVVALTVGDFNNDGRSDIAYFGQPDQLVIRYQSADGNWNARQQMRLPDVATGAWCLASGDLNGDGRTDIVVLGKHDTFLLLQPESGEFGTPVRLMNTSDQLGLVQVADLNDDGLDDLCYLAGDAVNRSLGIRLQTLDGQLGPEYLFDLERPRAVSVRDVDGDGSAEILTIDSRTGRLKVLKLQMTDLENDNLADRVVRYGFGKRGTGRDRDLAIADFDGNGRLDVVVNDPEAARLLLFRQAADRGLDLGTPFPSLTGGGVLRATRGAPRIPPQLFVHSETEKTVAISQWSNNRLTFPQALPIDGEPVGMELLEERGTTEPSLLVLTRDREGRMATYSLVVLKRVDDRWETAPVSAEEPSTPLSLKGTPERMLLADLTGDRFPELLIFQGSRPPLVLQRDDNGRWQELVTTGALGAGSIPAGAVFPGQIGPRAGLLVAQDNYVRLLTLTPEKRWEVADQVNAGEPRARIVGTALLDLDGRPGDELVMVDTGVKKLRVLQLIDGRYQPWKEVELGNFDFKTTRVADLNGDGRDDLVLFGADQFAVLYAGSITPTLAEIAAYESTLERSFPTDVLAGDLNSDGQTNLAIVDTRNRFLEILEYRPPSQLERAMYFTVFEEKGFTREEGTGSDPREGLIVDVTGDSRPDLVLLAHDRVLVYPQDPGGAEK